LFAGIGYGGSCFPKDVQALSKTAAENQYDFKMLDAVMETNEQQKTKLLPKLRAYFNGKLNDKKIAIWGLAFKPNTDDIREAPALYNIEELLNEGASISVYDPEAQENVKKLIGDKIEYAHDQYQVLDGADALLIMTEWPAFRTPDFDTMNEKLRNKVIFDGRNLFEPKEMEEIGYHYESIGRKPVVNNSEIFSVNG
jgi:UDPglucose 6-dehydrogenase